MRAQLSQDKALDVCVAMLVSKSVKLSGLRGFTLRAKALITRSCLLDGTVLLQGNCIHHCMPWACCPSAQLKLSGRFHLQ